MNKDNDTTKTTDDEDIVAQLRELIRSEISETEKKLTDEFRRQRKLIYKPGVVIDMGKMTDRHWAYLFGFVLVLVILLVVVLQPDLTPQQFVIVRIILAAAVAGVAAMIPGFLQVKVGSWLKAGGAMAVFAIAFFYTPDLVEPIQKPNPTDPFEIVLSCLVDDKISTSSFTFPYSDIEKNADFSSFSGLVDQLPNQKCPQNESIAFRMIDEVKVFTNSSLKVTSGANMGIILMPQSVIDKIGDEHVAFTQIKSSIEN